MKIRVWRCYNTTIIMRDENFCASYTLVWNTSASSGWAKTSCRVRRTYGWLYATAVLQQESRMVHLMHCALCNMKARCVHVRRSVRYIAIGPAVHGMHRKTCTSAICVRPVSQYVRVRCLAIPCSCFTGEQAFAAGTRCKRGFVPLGNLFPAEQIPEVKSSVPGNLFPIGHMHRTGP